MELGITPKITTGVLHASAGIGQVGAGVAEAPMTCFVDAVMALDRAGLIRRYIGGRSPEAVANAATRARQ